MKDNLYFFNLMTFSRFLFDKNAQLYIICFPALKVVNIHQSLWNKYQASYIFLLHSFEQIMEEIDNWKTKNKDILDTYKSSSTREQRASKRNFVLDNYIMPLIKDGIRSLKFGKYAPWNVLKNNNLFLTRPYMKRSLQRQVQEFSK